MDVIGTLAMRFHFGGDFVCDGSKKSYLGGREAMPYIDRDKVSLPEVVGHLRDHWNVFEGGLLHWLFPGKGLDDGLRVLFDDNACLYMSDCIVEGGVADIFVEDVPVEKGSGDESDGERNVSDYEDELVDMEWKMSEDECVEVIEKETVSMTRISESRDEAEKQIKHLQEFYRSPSEKEKKVIGTDHAELKRDDGSEDLEDSDYMLGDACSSDEDNCNACIFILFKLYYQSLD
jgi:hypothetical protein